MLHSVTDVVLHYVMQCDVTSVTPTQLFTSLGTFTFGFFEQDVSAEVRKRKPGLYKASQEGKYFNSHVSYLDRLLLFILLYGVLYLVV